MGIGFKYSNSFINKEQATLVKGKPDVYLPLLCFLLLSIVCGRQKHATRMRRGTGPCLPLSILFYLFRFMQMPKEVTYPYALDAFDVTLKRIIKMSCAPQCNSASHTTRKAGNGKAKILPYRTQITLPPLARTRTHRSILASISSFPSPSPSVQGSRSLFPHTSATPLNICPLPVPPCPPSAALGKAPSRSCSCHNLPSRAAASGTVQTQPSDWDPLLFSVPPSIKTWWA